MHDFVKIDAQKDRDNELEGKLSLWINREFGILQKAIH